LVSRKPVVGPKIDLSKVQRKGLVTTHPEIIPGRYYIGLVTGMERVGWKVLRADMLWYGINFCGFWDAGVQLDYGSYLGVSELYELITVEE
jgi:hypothetical protein